MTHSPRILVLGNPHAGDDGAALRAVGTLGLAHCRAGRPGTDLLELLEGTTPVLLLDVTSSGAEPGTVHRLPLARLTGASVAGAPLSSHGFGPAETLRLGEALGRPLPPGEFLGIEGAQFETGAGLSAPVAAALPRYCDAVNECVEHWKEHPCTKAE